MVCCGTGDCAVDSQYLLVYLDVFKKVKRIVKGIVFGRISESMKALCQGCWMDENGENQISTSFVFSSV